MGFFHQTTSPGLIGGSLEPFLILATSQVLKQLPHIRNTGELQISNVPDVGEMQISGVPDIWEYRISGVWDTRESRIPGVPDSGESFFECSLFFLNFNPLLQPLKQ